MEQNMRRIKSSPNMRFKFRFDLKKFAELNQNFNNEVKLIGLHYM